MYEGVDMTVNAILGARIMYILIPLNNINCNEVVILTRFFTIWKGDEIFLHASFASGASNYTAAAVGQLFSTANSKYWYKNINFRTRTHYN